MSTDALCPLRLGPAPTAGAAEYLADPSARLLVEFFQGKGQAALAEEDRQEAWYQDWVDYQARHGLYASVLSPRRYSSRGHHFNLLKLSRFLEVFAYYAPAHAYSLHVTFLGLFPILRGPNEALKKEAVARLEAGGLFAFGVSERAHGADLFANELTVRPSAAGGWVADGAKYYIGNANAACLISVLGKKGGGSQGSARRSPFVFFALRPAEAPALQNVRKIRTLGIRAAFVGELEVKGHPFPPEDVISEGREAWDAILDTVNFGKFFLGLGAVGICARAFAEAHAHLSRRVLYGKPVLAMPHLRAATAVAFARLSAMKLYAYRALDYLQAARADERRYLLFNAVQKAKVSTEGVKVLALLSESVGAWGYESGTYFEAALREVQLIPTLEGSTHINFGLTAQFLSAYLEGQGEAPGPPSLALGEASPDEGPYWLEAHDRNARTVRFGPCLAAYEPLRAVPNVRSFRKQVKAFRLFARHADASDAGLAIALGKCLATVAYAQLVAEGCVAVQAPASTVSVIFHALVEDLSAEALKLLALVPSGSASRALLLRVVRAPRAIAADLGPVSELIAARYGA